MQTRYFLEIGDHGGYVADWRNTGHEPFQSHTGGTNVNTGKMIRFVSISIALMAAVTIPATVTAAEIVIIANPGPLGDIGTGGCRRGACRLVGRGLRGRPCLHGMFRRDGAGPVPAALHLHQRYRYSIAATGKASGKRRPVHHRMRGIESPYRGFSPREERQPENRRVVPHYLPAGKRENGDGHRGWRPRGGDCTVSMPVSKNSV